MQWALIVLLIVGTLLLLVCITPIHIEIRYTRLANQDELLIRLRALFGLFRYTIHVPKMDLVIGRKRKLKIKADTLTGVGKHAKRKRPGTSPFMPLISRLFSAESHPTQKLHRLLPHLRGLTKVMHVLQFQWHTQLGLADAAVTGTAAGALWTLKASLLGLLSYFFSFQEIPKLAVTPRFHGISLDTEVNCIIRFSLGQAIVAAIKMGIYLLREGKKR